MKSLVVSLSFVLLFLATGAAAQHDEPRRGTFLARRRPWLHPRVTQQVPQIADEDAMFDFAVLPQQRFGQAPPARSDDQMSDFVLLPQSPESDDFALLSESRWPLERHDVNDFPFLPPANGKVNDFALLPESRWPLERRDVNEFSFLPPANGKVNDFALLPESRWPLERHDVNDFPFLPPANGKVNDFALPPDSRLWGAPSFNPSSVEDPQVVSSSREAKRLYKLPPFRTGLQMEVTTRQ